MLRLRLVSLTVVPKVELGAHFVRLSCAFTEFFSSKLWVSRLLDCANGSCPWGVKAAAWKQRLAESSLLRWYSRHVEQYLRYTQNMCLCVPREGFEKGSPSSSLRNAESGFLMRVLACSLGRQRKNGLHKHLYIIDFYQFLNVNINET